MIYTHNILEAFQELREFPPCPKFLRILLPSPETLPCPGWSWWGLPLGKAGLFVLPHFYLLGISGGCIFVAISNGWLLHMTGTYWIGTPMLLLLYFFGRIPDVKLQHSYGGLSRNQWTRFQRKNLRIPEMLSSSGCHSTWLMELVWLMTSLIETSKKWWLLELKRLNTGVWS